MSAIPLRDPEREAEEAVPAGEPPERPYVAEARGRAASVTALPYGGQKGSPEGTPDGYAPSPPAGAITASAAADLGRSLAASAGASRMTLGEIAAAGHAIWGHHLEAAARFDGALWRGGRAAWGVIHTPAAVAALAAASVTFSVAGTVAVILIVLAFWFWS